MQDQNSIQNETGRILARLEEAIGKHSSMVVAYSGGVDSALLAFCAHRILGESMIAVLGRSASVPAREEAAALAFLSGHGIPYRVLCTDELDIAGYRENNSDRCYHCKTELFNKLNGVAEELGFECLAYGANMDDLGDFRPGTKAAAENKVVSPLVEAGIDKRSVRTLAKALSLGIWNKPAAPCLASRIPYFSPIDGTKLKQVETAENILKDAGFEICRVRHHGDVARIEIPAVDRERFLKDKIRSDIVRKVKEAGFLFVTLDLEGFKSGGLNAAISNRGKKDK